MEVCCESLMDLFNIDKKKIMYQYMKIHINLKYKIITNKKSILPTLYWI